MQAEISIVAQNKDIQVQALSTTAQRHTLSVRQVSTQEPVSIPRTTSANWFCVKLSSAL